MFRWSVADKGVWNFLPVEKKVATKIREDFGRYAKGFGSLPVRAKIGKTEWNTSIFPDRKSGTYILPVKAKVRKLEDIEAGEEIKFMIKIGG
ncbi:DUF1905 domain-containing protein [Candidatus Kaiserbacteria bacterium]|nr:DUF1905 domain-containing protein [Candidatus Kaiserbacteria bacterium]